MCGSAWKVKAWQSSEKRLKLAQRFRDHLDRCDPFDEGFSARHVLGNPHPVTGCGRRALHLGEGFEGGGGHAGDGNRVAQRVEDFKCDESGACGPVLFGVRRKTFPTAATEIRRVESCLRRSIHRGPA